MILDCDLSRRLPQFFVDRISPNKKTKCWDWTGNLTGRDNRAFAWWGGKTRIAARVVYAFFYGDFKEELCVLHTCDNPSCVNPEHLYLGNQKDNARDRESRGRNKAFSSGFVGESNGQSKLTEKQVLDIIRNNTDSHSTIANNHGVSRSMVQRIKAGKAWKHLQEGGGRAYDS